MRRRALLAGAVVLVITTGATAPSALAIQPFSAPLTAAEPGLGIRLLDAPVTRKDDPRALASVVDHLRPGTVITRHVEVVNETDRDLRIQLYVGSATIRGGEFVGDPGRGSGEITTWAAVSPDAVQVTRRSRKPAEVRVNVPANASPGERYGVVWAEAPPVAAGAVKEVNRVGVRIYLSVGPGGEPASDFSIDSMTAKRAPDGRPVVTGLVHNTGGRAIDMHGSLSLSKGPGGLRAGPFAAELGTTLGVGQTEPVTVLLDKSLPNGPWLARLDLQSGLLKRAATATITFPDQGEAAAVDATLVQDGKNQTPWAFVGAGVGGALLVGLVLFFFFKRRARPEDQRDTAVSVS